VRWKASAQPARLRKCHSEPAMPQGVPLLGELTGEGISLCATGCFLDFLGFWVLELFRISIFGFRILFCWRPFDVIHDMLGAINFLEVVLLNIAKLNLPKKL
jgi:hypothetical protein